MSHDEPATRCLPNTRSVDTSSRRRHPASDGCSPQRQEIARANELAARNVAPDRVVDEVNKLLAVMAEHSQSILAKLDRISAEPRPTMATIRDHLGVINHEAALCRSALRNLKEYARTTVRGTPAVFDLRDALQDALRIALMQVEHLPDTSAALELGGDPIWVCGHRDRMARAFLNLCTSAFDAMELGGELHITTRVVNRRVEICFRDEGDGMDENTLARLFDPVFAANAPGDGDSLGLCVSRIIIEQHAGHIQVKNVPGKGTAVTVRLPVASQ